MILGGSSSAWKELCYFFTTGIVLSAFALPIVLARVSAVCYYLEYFKLLSMLYYPFIQFQYWVLIFYSFRYMVVPAHW